jgi:hypothetical protein
VHEKTQNNMMGKDVDIWAPNYHWFDLTIL